MAGKKKKGLTQKQELFCLAYVETGNASEAYRRAYSTKNSTKKSITENASRLMGDVNVLSRVEELQKEAQERTGVTVDMLVKELSYSAFFDPRTMFSDDGRMLEIHEMDEATARAVGEVTVRIERSEDGEKFPAQIVKIKAVDKLGGIDKLMRHLGGYEKDNNQSNKIVVSSLDEFYADGED